MMRKKLLSAAAALSLAGAALATFVPKQEPAKTREHALVTRGAGHWEGTLKMWMGAPDPMVSEAKEDVESLGELWTVSHMQTTIMGMPFEGSAVLGYDTDKKAFVGTWIDSMTTHITSMEGRWDAEKKAIVMEYEMDMGSGPMQMRSETVQDGDSYVSSFYSGEDLHMQIEMHRAKTSEAGAGR